MFIKREYLIVYYNFFEKKYFFCCLYRHSSFLQMIGLNPIYTLFIKRSFEGTAESYNQCMLELQNRTN